MEFHKRKNSQIFRLIPKGAEASTVLVGLHGFLEVDVPVRFIFVLTCPRNCAPPRQRSLSQESAPEFPQSASMEFHKRKNSQIFRRIPKGAEASTVLVGALEFLEEPAVAFVRLAHAVHLHGFLEVDVPVRFIFVLLCPKNSIDYFEIGRSLVTLLSNKDFHDTAYRANDKTDPLNAMNEFLADSTLPYTADSSVATWTPGFGSPGKVVGR